MWTCAGGVVVTGTSVELLEESALGGRLASWRQGLDLWGWVGPLIVTLLAGLLRFDRLASPHAVLFDETYYAKEAYSLLSFGYEHTTMTQPKGIADRIFLNGSPDQIWAPDGGSFVAHPPLGKW